MGLSEFEERKPYLGLRELTVNEGISSAELWPTSLDSISRINGVTVQNTGASDRVVEFTVNGGPYYVNQAIGQVTIPAGAGNGVAPIVDALPLILALAQPALILDPGWGVMVRVTVTLGPGDYVRVTAYGGLL